MAFLTLRATFLSFFHPNSVVLLETITLRSFKGETWWAVNFLFKHDRGVSWTFGFPRLARCVSWGVPGGLLSSVVAGTSAEADVPSGSRGLSFGPLLGVILSKMERNRSLVCQSKNKQKNTVSVAVSLQDISLPGLTPAWTPPTPGTWGEVVLPEVISEEEEETCKMCLRAGVTGFRFRLPDLIGLISRPSSASGVPRPASPSSCWCKIYLPSWHCGTWILTPSVCPRHCVCTLPGNKGK